MTAPMMHQKITDSWMRNVRTNKGGRQPGVYETVGRGAKENCKQLRASKGSVVITDTISKVCKEIGYTINSVYKKLKDQTEYTTRSGWTISYA